LGLNSNRKPFPRSGKGEKGQTNEEGLSNNNGGGERGVPHIIIVEAL